MDFLKFASSSFDLPNLSIDAMGPNLDFCINHIFSSKRLPIALACILIMLLLFLSIASLGDRVYISGVPPSADINSVSSAESSNTIDGWSRFAYTQYATTPAYLCNSIMLFEILHRSGNRADRLLMYPSNFQLQEGTDQSTESRLLKRARDHYNVKLKPIEVQRSDGGDGKSCWVF